MIRKAKLLTRIELDSILRNDLFHLLQLFHLILWTHHQYSPIVVRRWQVYGHFEMQLLKLAASLLDHQLYLNYTLCYLAHCVMEAHSCIQKKLELV